MAPSRILIGLGAGPILCACGLLVFDDRASGGSLASGGSPTGGAGEQGGTGGHDAPPSGGADGSGGQVFSRGGNGSGAQTTARGGNASGGQPIARGGNASGGQPIARGGNASGGQPIARGGNASGGQVATQGGNGGAQAACDPDVQAARYWTSGYALEIADRAPAERAFSLKVYLYFPEELKGAGGEDCQAALAPALDSLRGELWACGATELLSSWSCSASLPFSAVSAKIKAKCVRQALCWPSVEQVQSLDSYWVVIDRPWDTTLWGSEGCPLDPVQGCYQHCTAIEGRRLDSLQSCFERSAPATCTVRTYNTMTAGPGGCAVKMGETDEIYDFVNNAPYEPYYGGWRQCTEDELALHDAALSTQCP